MSAKKSINTAAGASDVEFGDDEILRFFSDEADKFDDTVCHVTEDSSSDDFLFEAWEAYKGSRFEKSKKTVIVQRAIDRFWTIFLKQKFDFVLHDVSVRFAGESAADCGGPFREFLTLATSRLADAGNMFFGDKSRIGFTAFPEHVIKKHYFTMGQLCGVSILHLGRGPECFHPAIARAIYDIKQPVEIEPFDDAMLEATLSEIENGNLVSLLEYNIVPAGRDKVDLKHLFVVSFLINNKFVAIDQFKKGMGSVSPSLVESCHFIPMRKYLEHVKDISYSFQDIVNIISYPQANSFDEGSNNLTRFQEAQTEFELFLSAIECGEILLDLRCVTFGDFLFFITGSDRIPPHGFDKSIDISFDDVTLPQASVCGISAVIPWTDISAKFVVALKFGDGIW